MTEPERAAAPAASAATHQQRGFFGHPWGLANLAGVEMWERFSFYGMQGLLAFYIYYSLSQGGLGMSEAAATSIVGAYGGLVYLSSVLGGWVADRVLGAEKTLVVSAVVIMIGHIALAVLPGVVGLGIGLVCVALGAGSLKTTTSTVLGDLYEPGDVRRDAAFSIYYMGVNIGGFIGPILTSLVWGWQGFHWGFGLAAVGMALGLLQYLLLRRHTVTEGGSRPTNPLTRAERVRWIAIVAGAAVVVAGAALLGLLRAENLSVVVVALTILSAVAVFAVIASSSRVSAEERSRVFSYIPLFIASAVFWTLFQQQFTVLAIYADQRLDRNVFGLEIAPSVVTSINPVFIIIFAGVFAAMWTRLGERQPSTPIKFALGTIIMGLAFLAFIPFSGGADGSVPFIAIVVILLLFTFAELCISPVGQSLATKLSPHAFHSQMVALHFISIALGSAAAGALSGFYSTDDEVPYFLTIGLISIAVGIVLVFVRAPILRLMRGVR
ncbi:peptide MFS transporter [Leucobacter chromiiresistens]|uniref:Proton-dependent oligopeptide transporter, POT family n=1 Tax=Leucobacter chromiiresistens TaxID=1079994 RepID=A0A1H0ZB13_9MICO|nr:peptide MFS transporter [Leucobacter chromiiresistens]SDQ24276.1 proton-dependent oligopeptide transporter, POT family [Leucobacter chromiiresistens]